MLAASLAMASQPQTLEIPAGEGPGKGRHVVLLAGDEEYRSEEALPQLAKILARRHGFRCTVVFSLASDGTIAPDEQTNQPGIEALRSADTCVVFLRFRKWPEAQMREFVAYHLSGRPFVALRTSTHAFDFPSGPFFDYSWRGPGGGFGREVLGESWVSHWGAHGSQATRTHRSAEHPVLNGVGEVFVPTDVYEAAPPADAAVILRGEVVAGMTPADPPATGRKARSDGTEQALNDPMMPVAWVRETKNAAGRTNRVFTTTMGSAQDLEDSDFRRLLVNAVYWSLGLDVPAQAEVRTVGQYRPSPFGFGGHRRGVRPMDLAD